MYLSRQLTHSLTQPCVEVNNGALFVEKDLHAMRPYRGPFFNVCTNVSKAHTSVSSLDIVVGSEYSAVQYTVGCGLLWGLWGPLIPATNINIKSTAGRYVNSWYEDWIFEIRPA